MNKCLYCNKKTKNPKFCSSSCAASFNNKKYPKRKLQGNCKICNKKISKRKTFCNEHKHHNPNIINWNKISIDKITKYKYQKNSRIRQLARRIYIKSNMPKRCKICGYDKTYHVAHIKPISTFSNNTMVGVVNNITNLVALCPNHHWEFDNNLIKLAPLARFELACVR